MSSKQNGNGSGRSSQNFLTQLQRSASVYDEAAKSFPDPWAEFTDKGWHVPNGEVRVTDPETGGQKGSKPERFDLIPWDAMEEVARVYAYGAGKYPEEDNWLRGYKWSLSFAALLRHVARFMLGEDLDPESGLLHTAHACWHCLTLTTFFLRKLGTDNRRKVWGQ